MNSKAFFFTAITDNLLSDKEGVGSLRQIGDKIYRWVYNNTGVAMVVGRSYFHGTANFQFVNGGSPAKTAFGSQTTYTEEAFTFGQSGKGTAVNTFGGVAMSAVPYQSFGWLQVYGYTAALVVNVGGTAIAVGDSLIGTTGQTYLVRDVAAGTAPTSQRNAIALAVGTTSAGVVTLGGAFIRALV